MLVLAVLGGARGWAPLLAFGLGGFAGGAALRQIVVAVRRHRWRGLVGRTNGGMIVHLGVVLVAVAFAASQSYVRQAEFDLEAGRQATFAGHEIVYLGSAVVSHDNRTERVAFVRVDDAKTYGPAIATYPFASQTIGIPSVRSTLRDDVALAVLSFPDETGPDRVILRVTVQPLVAWLWLGGIVMAAGTVRIAAAGRIETPPAPGGRGRRGAGGVSAVDRGDPDPSSEGSQAAGPGASRWRTAWIALPLAVAVALLVVVLATRDSRLRAQRLQPHPGRARPSGEGCDHRGRTLRPGPVAGPVGDRQLLPEHLRPLHHRASRVDRVQRAPRSVR